MYKSKVQYEQVLHYNSVKVHRDYSISVDYYNIPMYVVYI